MEAFIPYGLIAFCFGLIIGPSFHCCFLLLGSASKKHNEVSLVSFNFVNYNDILYIFDFIDDLVDQLSLVPVG